MIERAWNIGNLIRPGKVLIIYGPRRVGKTTLLNEFLRGTNLKYKLDSGDNIRTQEVLGSRDFRRILEYASGYDLLAIDEAQQIHGIGDGLKIIVDQLPGIIVIATGSSSFELAGAVGEPLTGRTTTVTLYPVAQMELAIRHNRHELKINHLTGFSTLTFKVSLHCDALCKKSSSVVNKISAQYIVISKNRQFRY